MARVKRSKALKSRERNYVLTLTIFTLASYTVIVIALHFILALFDLNAYLKLLLYVASFFASFALGVFLSRSKILNFLQETNHR